MKKGGGQKRLRENKGRQAKTNIKCPFLGEKQGFWSIGSKERKGNKTTKEKWGGFRSKWAGPSFFFFFFLFPCFFFFSAFFRFYLFLLFKKCKSFKCATDTLIKQGPVPFIFFLRVCFSVYLLKMFSYVLLDHHIRRSGWLTVLFTLFLFGP